MHFSGAFRRELPAGTSVHFKSKQIWTIWVLSSPFRIKFTKFYFAEYFDVVWNKCTYVHLKAKPLLFSFGSFATSVLALSTSVFIVHGTWTPIRSLLPANTAPLRKPLEVFQSNSFVLVLVVYLSAVRRKWQGAVLKVMSWTFALLG